MSGMTPLIPLAAAITKRARTIPCTNRFRLRRRRAAVNAVLAAGILYRGRKSTFRDAMLVPQLVFLPRARIAGSAAIFSSCWTMKAS